MKKKDEMDSDLALESKIFFNSVLKVPENHIPELCEIIITFSVHKLIEKKQYKGIEDLTTEDFVLATQQANAWMEYILGHHRH